jgi:hypothetical protein
MEITHWEHTCIAVQTSLCIATWGLKYRSQESPGESYGLLASALDLTRLSKPEALAIGDGPDFAMAGESLVSSSAIQARKQSRQKSIFMCDFMVVAHEGSNTVTTSMAYAFDGTVFNPSGIEKIEKCPTDSRSVVPRQRAELQSRYGSCPHPLVHIGTAISLEIGTHRRVIGGSRRVINR